MTMSKIELYNRLINLLWISSPYGHERAVIGQYLPKGGIWDDFGNYRIDKTAGGSRTLFACHMDTVGRSVSEVRPRYNKGILSCGNENAYCLGADDRAGMLCLTALLDANVPGMYVFHSGEERGAKGAIWMNEKYDLSYFDRAIEFDRKATTSIITHMMGDRVCSDRFCSALADELGNGFEADPTGVFTDVVKYKEQISEVVNLSVGYYNEHSERETLNVDWLIKIFIPSLLAVRWEELPTVRNPKEVEEAPSMADVIFTDINFCDFCNSLSRVTNTNEYGTNMDICTQCMEDGPLLVVPSLFLQDEDLQ
jgi:hypothetical protein